MITTWGDVATIPSGNARVRAVVPSSTVPTVAGVASCTLSHSADGVTFVSNTHTAGYTLSGNYAFPQSGTGLTLANPTTGVPDAFAAMLAIAKPLDTNYWARNGLYLQQGTWPSAARANSELRTRVEADGGQVWIEGWVGWGATGSPYSGWQVSVYGEMFVPTPYASPFGALGGLAVYLAADADGVYLSTRLNTAESTAQPLTRVSTTPHPGMRSWVPERFAITRSSPANVSAWRPSVSASSYSWGPGTPPVSGQWHYAQRQNRSGSAGGWPYAQRQNGGHTGGWPYAQRQNYI